MNILIISEYIAPTRSIASVRWTKISKYLKKKYDVNITILTNQKKYYARNGQKLYEKDELLEKDLCYFDEYIEFRAAAIYDMLLSLKNFFVQGRDRTINSLSKNVGSSGSQVFAKPTIKHLINSLIHVIGVNENVRNGYKMYRGISKSYDVIVSSYGPIWCHLLARKIKERDNKAFWVADFRDIYAGNPYETEKEYKRHKKFTSEKLNHADLITKVVDGLELFEDSHQKVFTLSNGFDWEERNVPVKPVKFRLTYTGTFYPKETNLSIIFRALRELIDEECINSDDLEVVYAGLNGDEFTRQADCSGLSKNTMNMGSIQRDKAIELQCSSAILLHSCAYSSSFKSLWSGKMFEYMMACKPIVVQIISDTPSEQCRQLPKLGGIGVEECRLEDTYTPMKSYIKEKYQEWKTTGDVTICRDEEYVHSFSYEKLADEFWDMLKIDTFQQM